MARSAASLLIWVLACVSAQNVLATTPGRTRGDFAVTPKGSFSYSIPIWSPPGVEGLQPSLSVSYDSGSGNGLLGVGWSLSGLSSISRCNKTYAQDGIGGSPQLDANDKFCLNGNRLRLISGTYGSDGATYGQELETFSQITSHGTAGIGPAWFEVKGRDGLTYEYGHTSDSAVPAAQSTSVRVWALSKVSDRNGNSMTFTYTNDTANGVYRPASIQYTFTGYDTSNNNYLVEFSYQSRSSSDQLWRYTIGGQNNELNLLHQITAKSLGAGVWNAVRSYTLNYEQASVTQRYRIHTIQECSPTDCFGPTTITYQDGQASWGSEVAQGGNIGTTTAYETMAIDLNGDGITDLVYPDASSGTWYYSLGTKSGVFDGPFSTGVSSANLSRAIPIDYNADGKKDVLVSINGTTWQVLFFQSRGNPFSTLETSIPSVTTGPGQAVGRDVNGDGREDLVYAVQTGSGWGQSDYAYYRLNTSSGFSSQNTLIAFSNCAQGCDRKKFYGNGSPFRKVNQSFLSDQPVVDFNGDGRADFLVYYEECNADSAASCSGAAVLYRYQLWISDSAGGYSQLDLTGYGQTGVEESGPPLIADFNGDGCSDVAYTNTTWRIRFGTCFRKGATSAVTAEVATGQGWGGAGTLALAMDWDGDGRADIVESTASSPRHWVVLRSTGANLSAAQDLQIDYPITSGGNTTVFTADVNGDGLDDLVYGPYTGGSGGLFTRLHLGVAPDLATKFQDAWGSYYAPKYAPLAQMVLYVHGSSATYPEQDFSGPLQVVTNVDRDSGKASFAYSYATAKMNLQGRGFEGFGSILQSWGSKNIQRIRWYGQLFPYTDVITQEYLKQSDGTLISTTVPTVTYLGLDWTTYNTRFFLYTSASTTKQYEVGGLRNGAFITQIDDSYTYDTYGGLTHYTRKVTDQDQSSPFYTQTWQSDVSTPITNNTSYWCLGRPDSLTVTNSVPGSSVTRTTTYTNDYVNCRTTQEVTEPGTPLEATTVYGFDGFGNVNSTTVTGKNPDGSLMAPRVSAVGYGSRGQFPVTYENALHQITTFGYNYDFGLKASVQDPNGVNTSWDFDDFGRMKTQTQPDGTKTIFTWRICVLSPANCKDPADHAAKWEVQSDERDSAGQLIRTSYVDFDREDRLVSRFGNTAFNFTQEVYRTYDEYGRVAVEYLPASGYAGDASYEYSYDLLGRVTRKFLYRSGPGANKGTNFAYAGRTVTITDPKAFATQKIYDPWGNLRKIIDPSPGGTTQLVYDAFNNLTSVTDAAGNVSSQGFNSRGMRVSATDPDRGSWTYTPNSLGEYISQKDAKNQTVSYSYDPLSRLTQRVEPEGTTTWTWGTSATLHNIGKLDSVSSPGGYGESYTYDSVGRVQSVTYSEDGTPYKFDYAYNSEGNLDTLTYPVSVGTTRWKLKYAYSRGRPVSVRNFTGDTLGTTYWTMNAQDVIGNPLDETMGNGVHIISGFDTATGHIDYRTSGTVSPYSNRQNLTYNWDLNENLTDRIDVNASRTEHFEYDALNRLDYSTLNGTTNLDVTLDAIGNILYRSDVGNYTYHPTRKHAVASTSNGWSFSYDSNGNMMTGRGATYTWTSYNLPSAITSGSVYSNFYYDANHQYWKQVTQYGSGVGTTRYAGGIFERIDRPNGVTDYRHFIKMGSANIIVIRRSNNANTILYSTTDHLGSVASITDSTGASYIEESFGAYGNRRGPTWSGTPSSTDMNNIGNTTRLGFTSETMIDNLNLVHLNGRVYDPMIGRFTSADPFILSAPGSQGTNRYAYVGNNPLSATDHSGFEPCHMQWIDGIETCTGTPRAPDPWRFPWTTPYDPYNPYYDEPGTPGGGGGGGDPQSPPSNPGTDTPSTPQPTRVDPVAPPSDTSDQDDTDHKCWNFALGVNGALAGPIEGPIGVGGSGGQAGGFSYEGSFLDSRFFWQVQAATMVGTGIFAGVGLSAQYGNGAIPSVTTTTIAWHSEVNVGAGLGISGQIDVAAVAPSGWSFGGYSDRLPGARFGVALGAAAGTGASTTTTVPSRTIRQMLRSIPGIGQFVPEGSGNTCHQ